MGIDHHSLTLIRSSLDEFTAATRVATFGRQAIHVGLDCLGLDSIEGDWDQVYLEDLLKLWAPLCHVDSFDISPYEGANMVFDLSKPLPERFRESYDVVADIGTSEHVIDPIGSITNAINITKVGGVILHCLPSNGMNGHGFWQFSPDLFHKIYSGANGFDETEVYIAPLLRPSARFRVEPAQGLLRQKWNLVGPSYVTVKTRKTSPDASATGVQTDYEAVWQASLSGGTAQGERGEALPINGRLVRLAKRYDVLVSMVTRFRLIRELASSVIPSAARRRLVVKERRSRPYGPHR